MKDWRDYVHSVPGKPLAVEVREPCANPDDEVRLVEIEFGDAELVHLKVSSSEVRDGILYLSGCFMIKEESDDS